MARSGCCRSQKESAPEGQLQPGEELANASCLPPNLDNVQNSRSWRHLRPAPAFISPAVSCPPHPCDLCHAVVVAARTSRPGPDVKDTASCPQARYGHGESGGWRPYRRLGIRTRERLRTPPERGSAPQPCGRFGLGSEARWSWRNWLGARQVGPTWSALVYAREHMLLVTRGHRRIPHPIRHLDC